MTVQSLQIDIETLRLLYSSLDAFLKAQSHTTRDFELQDIKADVKAQIDKLEALKKDIIKNE